MYLVKAGTLTIVARTPSEAFRIRQRLTDDSAPDVVIADMDGFPLDTRELEKLIKEIEAE